MGSIFQRQVWPHWQQDGSHLILSSLRSFWTFERCAFNQGGCKCKQSSTVDDYLDGDQINGFDQINGQKGYDDYLYVVNSGFLTNYLTDLTFEGFSFLSNNKLVILPLEKIISYLMQGMSENCAFQNVFHFVRDLLQLWKNVMEDTNYGCQDNNQFLKLPRLNLQFH